MAVLVEVLFVPLCPACPPFMNRSLIEVLEKAESAFDEWTVDIEYVDVSREPERAVQHGILGTALLPAIVINGKVKFAKSTPDLHVLIKAIKEEL